MPGISRAGLATLLVLSAGVASATTVTYTDEATFLAATASLSLDGFESGAWQPAGQHAPPVTNLGNTWSSANNLVNQILPQYVRTGSHGLTGAANHYFIDVVFGAPTTAVGVWIYNLNTLVRLEAFDEDDASLGFVDMGIGNVYTFRGITTMVDIARVRIGPALPPPDNHYAIDDFVFGDAASVPAPPAGVLLAAGLAALRRRSPRATRPA